jgi:hypothetical protein
MAAPPPLIPRPSTTQAWFVAGLFVLLALPVSLYEVALQLEHYTRPRLQLRVVRILFMVPVYALDSWLALRFRRLRLPLDAVRECYEAFVIYNFFMYLLAYLQDEYGDLDAYFGAKDDVPHLGALARVLPPWRMGAPFFRECQQGVLAYVVVRPLMTAAGVLAHVAGVPDGDPPVDGAALSAPHRPHSALAVWAALANNVSQLWALYCLVLFYTATRHELAPIRPLSKFLVVKAVVFLSYWQGIAISLAVWLGVIKASDWAAYTAGDVAAGLQEFLICVEMFFAALAHAYAFPPSDYADPGGPPPAGLAANLRVMFAFDDVVADVSGGVGTAAGRAVGVLGGGAVAAVDAARRAPAALLEATGLTGGGRRAGGTTLASSAASEGGWSEGSDSRALLRGGGGAGGAGGAGGDAPA